MPAARFRTPVESLVLIPDQEPKLSRMQAAHDLLKLFAVMDYIWAFYDGVNGP